MFVSLYINDIKIKVEKNSTVLQACNSLNLDIPKFCYQNNLKIAGNCRMCLVEIQNSIKPVASCALPVSEGLKVYTDTPLVKKARESVLEFLLLNHPLDCPICDQGGECDLQDQTLIYGSDRSRFFELKRSVEDKNCGPFIKTIMTRCIHCTRCVRFAQYICGVDDLGTTGRGNHTEIGFYLEKMFTSEFSANVIDLCPVGALTNKVFAFKARSWELKNRNSIDILDTIGTNIKVSIFNNEIVRILPKKNDNINIEWISNKTRFFFDSLNYQRLENPLKKNGNYFKEIEWDEAFKILNNKLINTDASKLNVVLGDFIEINSLFVLKNFLNTLGKNNVSFNTNKNKIISNNELNSNMFNSFISNIKDMDNCILIDCCPRKEASILNLHIKKRFEMGNFKVYNFGNKLDLTFECNNLGNTNSNLVSIIEGKHFLCKDIIKSKKTLIIFGQNFLNKKSNTLFINFFKKLSKLNNNIIFSNLIKETGFLNYVETSFENKKFKSNSNCTTILYNTDLDIKKDPKEFLIYQGHHFTKDAQISDLIIPLNVYFEKNSIFLNLEGKIQKVRKVLKTKNNVRSDINFLKNLHIFINKNNKKNYIYKKNSILKVLPYLKKDSFISNNKVFNNTLELSKINLNISNTLLNRYNNSNILEKYSKTLVNAYNMIHKKTNFN